MQNAQKEKKRVVIPNLYQKRGFFYYRFKLPKFLCAPDTPAEIRVALRTSYKRIAKKIVIELHACTLRAMEKWHLGENVNENFEQLKKELHEKLNVILSATPKIPLSYQELRNRLTALLQDAIEADETSEVAYTITQENEDKHEKEDLSEIYAGIAKKIAGETQSAEDFEYWGIAAIFEMLDRGIIKAEELTQDNFMQIAQNISQL